MGTKFEAGLNSSMVLPSQGRRVDHILVASIFLLAGLGLVTLYSSSYGYARIFYGAADHFISRQLIFSGVGFALFVILSLINLELLRKFIKPLVFFSLILCVLPFIPGFAARQNAENNAARWIGIGGFTYQPSEFAKLVLPLYLAHIFDKKKDDINVLYKGIIPPALIVGLFFVIIFCQNNFSTAVFLALNALVMFFLAGMKFRYLFSAIIMLIPTSALLALQKEHRILRFLSFLQPDFEPLRANYQVRSSILSINSGGFWGKGIGQGTRKITSIPEVHSDFIFSAYAEELGFIGVLLFCALFGVFAFRGYLASMRNENPFARLLGCGLVTMIISQVLLNIAVVAGALPATGIPLPFFSAGGSSLLTTFMIAGLLVNISRYSRAPVGGALIAGEAVYGR